MKALVKRFFLSVHGQGLIWSFFGMVIIGSALSAATGDSPFGSTFSHKTVGWLVGIVFLGSAAFVVRFCGMSSTSLAENHVKFVDPLLSSTEEYCLLLRPFGYDGRIVLPDMAPIDEGLSWWRKPRQYGPYRRTRHIEQVIADAAMRACGMRSISVVDSRSLLAPPGPEYFRASHSEWQQPVRRLLARAHTIVILLPPGLPRSNGLEWEVRTIAALGLQSRVIFVLPPPEHHPETRCPVTHRFAALATLLRYGPNVPWPELSCRAAELHDRVPDSPLLARIRGGRDPDYWVVVSSQSDSKPRTCGTGTYLPGLVEYIGWNYLELADLGFRARYAIAERSPRIEPELLSDPAGATPECPVCLSGLRRVP